MVNKRFTYKPVGDLLSVDVTLTQAAFALDDAAKLFMESSNPVGLLEVADRWIEMTNAFFKLEAGEEEEEEVVEVEESTTFQLGFNPRGVESGTEEEVEID